MNKASSTLAADGGRSTNALFVHVRFSHRLKISHGQLNHVFLYHRNITGYYNSYDIKKLRRGEPSEF